MWTKADFFFGLLLLILELAVSLGIIVFLGLKIDEIWGTEFRVNLNKIYYALGAFVVIVIVRSISTFIQRRIMGRAFWDPKK